jgi:hypothetical protein
MDVFKKPQINPSVSSFNNVVETPLPHTDHQVVPVPPEPRPEPRPEPTHIESPHDPMISWSARDHGLPPDDPAILGSTWPPPDPRQLALRRKDPNDQFPPPLSEKLCEPRGLSGGNYDANKQVLDLINVEPDNADG